MIRAHKIRLNPTPEQEAYLKQACGTARFTYNWALAEWKRCKSEGAANADPVAVLKKQFNAIKREQFPWVMAVPKSASDTGFFRLKTALKNYYESKSGKRKGSRVGFPKFKSKKRTHPSFTMAYDQVDAKNYDGHNFWLPKLAAPINMAEALRFRGQVKESTVSYAAGHWWVAVVVELEQPKPIEHAQASVGIDLGLTTLATLSDGQEFENQKLLHRELNKLKRLSRQVSRRSVLYKLRQANPAATQQHLLRLYGLASAKAKAARRPLESNRWRRAKKRLDRFYAHIANQRAYTLHKMISSHTVPRKSA